ncbi:MAG: class I SAM-dependent methyltransferase, partial [Patescibacteria group bacterium]|nr:class I SAM-dependent methyltransferase [Patescibacteria group bacterium]
NESCKQQMIQFQDVNFVVPDFKNEEEVLANLRHNLLRLTAAVADHYDDSYDKRSFAVRSYRKFEEECIAGAISNTCDRSLAIDLGCATGMQSLRLAEQFTKVIGFDLSPEMVRVARKKITSEFTDRLIFEEHDLENGIPLPDESASFVLMNLGTASDIRDIQKFIGEIMRILKKGGRFLMSFYNKNALVYKWDFLPWPDGLAAEINQSLSCLDVHLGKETYPIFAKSYTSDEVEQMLGRKIVIGLNVATFPTVSSLLPNQLFSEGNDRAREAVDELDRYLSTLTNGAYVVATGEKGCSTICV